MWLKQSVIAGSLALLFTSAPALAQETAKTTFQAEDIFQLEYANQVSISPDGKYIAYIRNSFDDMKDNTHRSLWLIDTETGQHLPIFDDEFSYGSLAWSNDGTRLAFASNRSEKNQIHVHWIKEQRTAKVTHVNNSPGSISWSNDDSQLAFTMSVNAEPTPFAKSVKKPKKPKGAKWSESPIIVEEAYYQRDGRGVLEPAHTQLFVVPAEGGTARQLTDGPYRHGGPLAWTEDDSQIVFSGNRSEDWAYQVNESDLYSVSLSSKEVTQVTDKPGRESSPQFSPDGERLAYLHSSNEPVPYHKSQLWVMDWSERSETELQADFDRSFSSPQWTGNDSLAVSYADQGKTVVADVTLSNELTNRVDDVSGVYVSRPYTMGSFTASKTGAIAYTKGSEYRPADVGYQPQDGEAVQFTQLNEDLLGHRELGKVHEIRYESRYDGQEIHGWYITPPNYDENKEYPLLLEIHGGPHLSYGPHFAAEHQRYAAEGYVVLYVNHRGSTSYGKDFAMLLDGNYSSPYDFADHMSGIDLLIDKGIADSDNLFIAGGSAGGIATAYAVGLTNRFNAAAATNPVINWVSKVLTADSSIGQITNQFPGMPWEELEHYWQRSPLSMVGDVETPVMLFTGEKDRRTPISETEQFYQALKLQKVDTAMVRVPGAFHGVTARPSNMIAKIEHALAWFEQYKK